MKAASQPSVLVTGGAGYIGAHTAKALHERGFLPVVFDDLSSGSREAVRWGPLIQGDLRDRAALSEAVATHQPVAVIHFAGLIEVGRSTVSPDLFWEVNVAGTVNLLTVMREQGVERLVFSSSAAVYGQGGRGPLETIAETADKAPASPYGDTKLAAEWMIAAQCRAHGLTAVALRYFNAAGADPSGLIGEAHEPETHLIPLAIAAALGDGKPLTVFGHDFDTPDGACLRDYVHVTDLAAAHLAALTVDLPAGAFEAVNVGSGRGHSVLQVVEAVGRAVGVPVPHAIGPRRAGDPPSLVADPRRARELLGWAAQHSALDEIVADALRWEREPAYGAGHRDPANRRRSPTPV
ncbi:MAG TPA: UDP-glucose 4-epimerase GalE [Phenylobacterium sp.]|jgi:UDP-glucose-4-epimerase GalE|uniref:UDP-glucose 4-epimerase GalE n=1 Tax=Phenylobacterium sp. TaxID=1871053 RepID=UPI002B844026|nr:UDP-glucose 4-epimerase GalE [Phenylobacterium sp.]HXA40269.1 UDP-glucose 4-epimerase GalE [Phenylobacterium sp.]